MPGVATKNKKSDEQRGPGRPPSPDPKIANLNARLPRDHALALEAYLGSQRPAPTVTAVVLTALEDFLRSKGFWPPA
jgi:hypothetical protein